MGRLAIVAYNTRRAIKYGSIGIVALLIFLKVFSLFRAYWRKVHPPPPPPPTVLFGKLPKLRFNSTNQEKTNFNYRLENVSGALPKLDTITKVFVMPKSYPNLLAWDKTKTWARGLGFTTEPEKISDFELKFVTSNFPQTTLQVNVLTRNFKMDYDWQNDREILTAGSPPPESQAISMAKNFLQSIGVLNEDLTLGKGKVEYLKYKDGGLVTIPFASEANFVRVHLFRQDINNLPLLPRNPTQANVKVTLSSSEDTTKEIIGVDFVYFPVYKENFATYPLKDVNTAWNQLKNGGGYIANLGNNSGPDIVIRNVYLAYFEDSEQQDFLQPIFVFEGDNEFFAYVPAVSDEWFQ